MTKKKLTDRNIISTLVLILFITGCFIFASFYVNHNAMKSCFSTLDDAASQAASDIRLHVKNDREQLNVIADLLSQHKDMDSETVRRHLASFRQRGSLSAVGLLLPDNQLVLGTDSGDILDNIFDFDTELSRLPYISGVTEVPSDKEKKLIYQAVPVEKDGKTVGILYGFSNLRDFANNINVTAFDGNAQLFVADGKTGDFLIDTWHDTLGNIWDKDIMNRKVKSGYDYQAMKEDFTQGKSGHIAFWSNTAKEYLYSYYGPVGVDQWMVQLTVPESVAFASAIHIRRVLYFVAAAEILVFVLYFLWVLSNAHRDAAQKERQLAQSYYMYDVQQTLFDAHKNPSLITAALDKVAKMLTSQNAFLIELNDGKVKEAFFSNLSQRDRKNMSEENKTDCTLSQIFKDLSEGKNILIYPEDIPRLHSEQDKIRLTGCGISSLMLVPVAESSGKLTGILGGCNMKRHWTDNLPLECVSRNFMMALSNIQSYRQIEKMGMIDMLTGLRNRNCYEHALDNYSLKKPDSLCCLYIDANGLHELNNTLGHAAGDEMLIYIGSSLKMIFGSENTYRIGGDEFAAFTTDCTKEEIQERIDRLNKRMDSKGYHISVGQKWLKDSFDVKDMVSAAESDMYEAKRLYYQNGGKLSKARMMNQKLEQTLLEKKDSDAFLDIISSRFMGVYIVDMNNDIARVIYKPSYFSDILEENHYHFIPSMQVYIQTFVIDQEQMDFMSLLDYDRITDRLVSKKVIKYKYQKKDGTNLILRIYPAKDDAPSCTIWMFEKDPV